MNNIPEKLFEVKCEVIVKYEDCALVLTKEENQIVYVSSDFCLTRDLRDGDTVYVNAKMAPKQQVIAMGHVILPFKLKIGMCPSGNSIFMSSFVGLKGAGSITSFSKNVGKIPSRRTGRLCPMGSSPTG